MAQQDGGPVVQGAAGLLREGGGGREAEGGLDGRRGLKGRLVGDEDCNYGATACRPQPHHIAFGVGLAAPVWHMQHGYRCMHAVAATFEQSIRGRPVQGSCMRHHTATTAAERQGPFCSTTTLAVLSRVLTVWEGQWPICHPGAAARCSQAVREAGTQSRSTKRDHRSSGAAQALRRPAGPQKSPYKAACVQHSSTSLSQH